MTINAQIEKTPQGRGSQNSVADQPDSNPCRFTGKVLWFSNAKGYGFIKRDDGGGDVFVHFSGIEQPGYRTLREFDRVEFVLSESPVRLGRMQAINVRVRS